MTACMVECDCAKNGTRCPLLSRAVDNLPPDAPVREPRCECTACHCVMRLQFATSIESRRCVFCDAGDHGQALEEEFPEPDGPEDHRMDERNEVKPAALPWWQDLNSDGVPDVRQSFFWNALWRGAVFVAGLVPAHTIYARTVNHAEQKRAELFR